MSGHGSLLPIPDDPRFPALIAAWPTAYAYVPWFQHPRSHWLHDFERLLAQFYPSASSRDLSLTARHAAPFWLKDGPDVP